MKKRYKQSNIVLHVWLLTPDDTCVALALSSFAFGTRVDFDHKVGHQMIQEFVFDLVVQISLSVRMC